MKSRTDFEPMREREPLRVMLTQEFPTPTPKLRETSNINGYVASTRKTRKRTIWQCTRFGLVGCMNTTIGLLVLNGELLYRLNSTGCTHREVGVHHLPRRGGRATGVNLRVIGHAFWELFVYTRKRRYEGLSNVSVSSFDRIL